MISVANDNAVWKNHYTAALFQDDATKVPTLIAKAEAEIVTRARMLFGAPHENAREMRALDSALRMLQVLKKCVLPQQSLTSASNAEAASLAS
jgi:hypothetical protein